MIGTIVNTGTILAGSIIGSVAKKKVSGRNIRMHCLLQWDWRQRLWALIQWYRICLRVNIPYYLLSVWLPEVLQALCLILTDVLRAPPKNSVPVNWRRDFQRPFCFFCIGTLSILGPMERRASQ